MSKEIILTPMRTSNTESFSMISPNTQTLYAPRADIETPDEYGLISYSDLGDFTYTKEEIDNKDSEVLRQAKEYADSQDVIVLASANEHSDNNLEIAKQYSNNNLETAKQHSDNNLEIAKQYSNNNLETAKNYTDNELLNYYTKVEVDNKNEDVLNSAKNYTYSKEEIDTKDTALSVKIEAVEDKSDGRLKALSFEDNDQIIAWIDGTYTYVDGVTGETITPADVTIGQNIYNKNLVQNDYWVSKLPITSINDLSILITDKNELNATDVKFNPENENKLSAANVQDAVDELTEVVENRTAIFELGNFVLNSENWALNSENGLYEYIFTNEALTNAITQIIEFTPNVESAKLINDNNIVIYNNVETIDNNGITQAIIRAESKPSFDIVCQVRIKTNALHLTGSAKLYASDVVFKNNRTDLGATDVQNAIVEINTKTSTNARAIGTLSSLNTTKKTDLVSAVNELNTNKEVGTYLYASGTVSLSSESDVIDIIMDNILYSNIAYDRVVVFMSSAGGSSGNKFCCFSEDYAYSNRDIYGIVPKYMVYDAGSYDADMRQVIPVSLNFYHDSNTDIQHARIKTCNFHGTTSTYPSFRSGTGATVQVYARRS